MDRKKYKLKYNAVKAVEEKCPEFKGTLVPLCEYRNGKCTEFKPCGKSLVKEIK